MTKLTWVCYAVSSLLTEQGQKLQLRFQIWSPAQSMAPKRAASQSDGGIVLGRRQCGEHKETPPAGTLAARALCGPTAEAHTRQHASAFGGLSVHTAQPSREPLCEAVGGGHSMVAEETRATSWDLACRQAYSSVQSPPRRLDSCAPISSPLKFTESR